MKKSKSSINRDDKRCWTPKRPGLLMALEPRILYDGAGAEVAADGAAESMVPQTSEPEAAQPDNTADAPEVSGQEQDSESQQAEGEETEQESAEPATGEELETTASETSEEPQDESVTDTVNEGEDAAADSQTSDAAEEQSPTETTADSETETQETAAGDDGDATQTVTGEEATASEPVAVTETSDDSLTTTTTAEADSSESTAAAVEPELPTEGVREIVFVDSKVEDHETLISGIVGDEAEYAPESPYTMVGDSLIVTLGDNPLDQMDQVLSHYQGLEAIHLISHGDQGELILGDEHITNDTLGQYEERVAAWGSALGEDGDLLLYGCTVAADGAGQEFVDSIAALSGADVAASDDATGNADQGGDWDLEVTTGPIEAASVLNDQNAAAWQGILALYNTGTWVVTSSGNNATAVNTTGGITTTVTFTTESSDASFTDNNIPINDTLNSLGIFGVPSGTGAPNPSGSSSLSAAFVWDTTPEPNTTAAGGTGLITITFSEPVTNPVLHLERIGAYTSTLYATGLQLDLLTADVTLVRLDGTDHFDVTGNRISNNHVGLPTSASHSTSTTVTSGTAGGSVLLQGTFTTLTFRAAADADGLEGPSGADAIEIAFTFSPTDLGPVVDLNSSPAATQTVTTTTTSVNLVTSGDFGTAAVATPAGWTETGSNGTVVNGRYVWTDAPIQTLSQTISAPATEIIEQSTSGGVLTTTTTEISYDIKQIAFDVAWDNTDATSPNDNRLEVRYDGTLYARFETGEGAGTQGAWTYFNGATGNRTTLNEVPVANDETTGAMTRVTITLPTGVVGESSTNIEFSYRNGSTGAGSDDIAIDNVAVMADRTVTTTTTTTDLVDVNHSATFTEGGAPVAIADVDSSVFDVDSASMQSATITLTNPQTGDQLLVGGSAAASGTLVNGVQWTRTDTVVTFTNIDSKGDYANAIEQVQFNNTGIAPNTSVTRDITVTVTDEARTISGVTSSNTSNTAHCYITVDDVPNAVNDHIIVTGYAPVTGTLATNDTPSADGGNVWAVDNGPTSGTVTVNPDGSYTYTPNATFTDSDSFTYTITDADGDVSTATVTIQGDSDGDGVVNATDIDDDNDGILDTVEQASHAYADLSHATLTWNTAGTVMTLSGIQIGDATGTLTATSINGAVLEGSLQSPYSFTLPQYTPTGSATEIVLGLVTRLYDNPSNSVVFELTFDQPVSELTLHLRNVDYHQIQFTGSHSETLLSGGSEFMYNAATRTLYDADPTTINTPSQNGYGSIRITAADGGPLTSISFRSIDNPNIAPATSDGWAVAFSGFSDVDTDSDGIVDRLDIDSDNDGITDNVEAQTTAGYIAPTGTGAAMTDTDHDGLDDAYDATVSGGAAGSLGLTPVNTDSADLADWRDADSDNDGRDDITERGDGQPTSVTSITDTDRDGLLDIFEAGTVNDGFDVNDENRTQTTLGLSSDPDLLPDGSNAIPLTTDLHFRDLNDPPIDGDEINYVNEDETLTVGANEGLLVNSWDMNGDMLSVNSYGYTDDHGMGWGWPAGMTATIDGVGDITINSDGSYSFTPVANYTGPVPDITYTVDDGHGGLDSSTLQLIIIPVDDLPVAVNDTITVTEDTPVSETLATNDTPSGDGGNVWTLATPPTNGTVTINPDGSYTYTPNANFNGSDSFTYTITDGDGDTSTAAVTVNVSPVDDLPVAVDDTITATEDTPVSGTLVTNDTPSGDGGNVWTVATLPTNGTVIVNLDGSYTYTPNANFNGSDSFTYTITDVDGDTSTATVTVTVDPVDDLPVAVNDTITATEDTPVSGTLVTNDTPSGDGGNVWTVATPPTNGTVTVNPDGSYTYTPNANFNGSDSFTYTITDGDGDTSTAAVTVNVSPVDDLPVAVDDTITANEDTPVSGTLVTNDTPSGDGGNVWTVATLPTNGAVIVNPDGSYTYTPNANFNGSDSFTYTITDADGDTSTATVTVNVAPVDDLPLAVDDTITATEDTPVSGTLVTNDVPSGDGGNVWAVATPPANGTVTVNPDGSYTYTPNANFNGSDSFTYTITDVDGDTSTAAVTVTVTPVDDLPLAVDDTITASEDTSVSGTLAGNDTPSGDGGNFWTVATPPTNGTVVVNPDGTYTYTPNANFNGSDSFTYTIKDTDGDVSTATVTVNVSPVDDLPIAVNDAITVTEDTPVSGTLATNDTPSGDGGNVWAVATPPANGTVTVNPDGSYTYTPNANFNGSDSFTYTIKDADGDVSTATVTVNVSPVDDLPVAVDDTITVTEDTPVSGTLVTNDTPSGDGGNIWALATPPANGTVTVKPDGSYTYTPNANFNGSDSFTYTITDVDGDTSTATVTVNVSPVGDLPVAVDDTITVTEDTPVSGTLVTNDTPSGDGGNEWALATPPTNGTVIVNADGTYTYTPSTNFNGNDSFTYTIKDADGDVSTATVTVTVSPVDDLPTAVNDTVTATEDTPVSGTLATNDTPSGDGGNVWTVATSPVNGTVTVKPDGSYTYTPNANFNGSDSFTYTITDSDGDTSIATVTVTVNPVNDLPVAVDDAITVTEDTSASGNLATNDTPSGDGGNEWALATPPTNGTVVVNPDGTYTYTPDANFNGSDSFTYTITDADGSTSTAIVTVTVDPDIDPPLAVDDAITTPEDTPVSGNLATNDTLPDGVNVWTVTTPPANGTVIVNFDGTYTYTPYPDFNGSDSFTYTIKDEIGDTSTATVTVTVNPVDDLPIAVDDAITVTEDTVASGTLATNDTPSGDGGNVWALATPPTNGTVVVNPDGTYTYTPGANFNGNDSFTYTIKDADGDVSTATVTVTVNPVDDLPVAVNDAITVTEDTPVSGNLATNDTPSGDGGNVWTVATPPTNGTVVVNPDGTYTYTPGANFNGNDSFTYTIKDADGDVSTATVTVTVNPVDDLPVAANDAITVTEDTPVSGNLATNDTPSGDGGNVWTVATPPTNGTVVVNPDGTYTYTPGTNFNGNDSFTYTIKDADGDVSTATVTVTVNPVDDLPVAVNDTVTATEDTPVSGTLATNDTPSGDGGNEWALATPPTNGTVVVNPDGTYTYTPDANFNGNDSFTYTIKDADGDISTATVTVTVTPVDDQPVAVNDTITATEDTPVSGTLVTNDTPSGDGGNVWTVAIPPTNGTVTVNPDGTYTYTPGANFNGSDSFTYTITDVDGDTSTATVNVTVNPVDDLPLAVNDTITATEDTPVSGTLVTNDTPSGDGGNVWTVATPPTNGTVTVNPDGSYTYTPGANFNGSDSFTYTITDGDGDTSTTTVNVTVNPVDDLPLAVNDTITATEDTPVSGTLVTNDTPSGDGGNVWTMATPPTNGTVIVNPDGSYTYTPGANFNGSDSFTYTITDGDGDTSTAAVTVTVDPVDDQPVAVNDTITATEDTPVSGTLVTNDTPSGDGGNVWTVATQPTNGTVIVNLDGSYTYTPNANFNGSDSFTYTITDVDGDTSTATVTVTVNPVDDLPVAVNDTITATEDNPVSGTLVTNDTPSGDGGNVWAVATLPTSGTVTVNPDGSYTYTPNANFNGSDSFTYTITDVDGDTSTAAVTVTVNPVDDLPVAVDDTITATEDTPVSGTLVTNDTPSGDGGNVWTVATQPANGTVTVNPDGSYTYTPNANFNGSDSFTYTITDGDGDTSTAAVTVNVSPVDDLPVAVDDTITATEDTPVSGTLVTNDTPSGDGGNVWTVATPPTNGTVIVNLDGSYTYTPNANFNGSDTFTYTINDGDGDTSTATVTVTVNPVDDLPVAVNDTITVAEDTSVSGTLAGNDTPSGDGGNVWTVATPPANGTVTVNPDGSYTYTPNANFNGSDSFTYTITDVDGDTSTATVNVTVNPVDDLPVAVNDTITATEDTPVSGTLVTNDTPSPDGGNVWTVATPPTNGSVTVNPDGSYTYTPGANFNGSDSFTYTITDVDGDVSTATVTVNVEPVNDPPAAVDDTTTTAADSPISSTIPLIANDSDPDGNILTVEPGTFPTTAGGSITINPDGSYVYTPPAGFTGTDTVDYTVTDGHGGSDKGTLSIIVTPVSTVQDVVPAPEDNGPRPERPLTPPATSPNKSTGLLILYPQTGIMAAAGNEPDKGDDSYGMNGADTSRTIRHLGIDGSLDMDANSGEPIGTAISQYIHDTVNHTWEKVEQWYGMGTPASEMVRYDMLGGARDEFNGAVGFDAMRQLEHLSHQLDAVLNGPEERGEQAASLSPILGASRSLQHQLNKADLYNRDALMRLAR